MKPSETSTENIDPEQLRLFLARLKSVEAEPRKLLAQIVELAYSESQSERAPDTAYVPEILESSGLDVDRMYTLLELLQRARLLIVESQYPFESAQLKDGALLGRLYRMCRQRTDSLRSALVELRFDSLGLVLPEQQPDTPDTAFLLKLGEDIRAARTRMGMTRKMLAKESGVSERFLAQVESGSGNASVLVLRQIASALKLPVGELFGAPVGTSAS